MAAQIYDENTSEKYPLEDWDETAIPTDVLVDLSLSVPDYAVLDSLNENSNLVLTNLVVTPAYAFVSIELPTGEPLCHVMVLDPVPFRIYPMTAESLVTGWIVFGPGVSRPASFLGVNALVSFKCICANGIAEGGAQQTLEVNGVSYVAPPVLTIRTNELMGENTLSGSSVFVLSRNNTEFTTDMLQSMLRVINPNKGALLYSINGVLPDENGDVLLEGFTDFLPLVGSTSVLGAIIGDQPPQNCYDWYAKFRSFQKLGSETPGGYWLPLDEPLKRLV